jgi:hypothetical protein
MPESADFSQKLRKLRIACVRAADTIMASDKTRNIQLLSQPKGALFILSRSGRDKRIRFEITETDDGIITLGYRWVIPK